MSACLSVSWSRAFNTYNAPVSMTPPPPPNPSLGRESGSFFSSWDEDPVGGETGFSSFSIQLKKCSEGGWWHVASGARRAAGRGGPGGAGARCRRPGTAPGSGETFTLEFPLLAERLRSSTERRQRFHLQGFFSLLINREICISPFFFFSLIFFA